MKREGNTKITWFLRGHKRRGLVSTLIRYFAVSRTQKLYETKAVSEGIRHERQATPFLGDDRPFQERPTCDRPLHRRFTSSSTKTSLRSSPRNKWLRFANSPEAGNNCK